MREGWKEERTALINRMRGLLKEFGLVFPRSANAARKGLVEALHDERVPSAVRELVQWAREDLERLDHRIAACDRAIGLACRGDPTARRLQEVMGVGPTTADAVIATAGGGLAGIGASPILQRWQGTARRDHQARRCLPAYAAHPRGTIDVEVRPESRSIKGESPAEMGR